jgi:L-fucose mutarotase/ribose pyranase (RbsD/FucU family)
VNTNPDRESVSWEFRFERLLPLFGHRNFIVVADAAYPAQSNPGIETIATDADHTAVLGKVLNAIAASNHIRANVYLDAELRLVTEKDAPGVTVLRNQLTCLLAGKSARELAHEEIIARLDQTARLFRILVIKSTLTIPYSSVFLELDCGYWNGEAEKRLRSAQSQESASSLNLDKRAAGHAAEPTESTGE